jgi:membrane protease YdiL (CAAX protease family)
MRLFLYRNGLILLSIMRDKLVLFTQYVLAMIAIRIFGASVFALGVSTKLLDKSILGPEVSLTDSHGLVTSLILIILVIPIVEEFAFRGWLVVDEKVLMISLVAAIFLFSQIFLNVAIPEMGKKLYLYVAIICFISAIILVKKINATKKFIAKNLTLLTYISIGLFSLMHATNYEIPKMTWKVPLSLLFVLISYPFAAYLLTRLRMKMGLLWSISLHIITNSLILIPVFFNDYKP